MLFKKSGPVSIIHIIIKRCNIKWFVQTEAYGVMLGSVDGPSQQWLLSYVSQSLESFTNAEHTSLNLATICLTIFRYTHRNAIFTVDISIFT